MLESVNKDRIRAMLLGRDAFLSFIDDVPLMTVGQTSGTSMVHLRR